jgi:hypothetical protein
MSATAEAAVAADVMVCTPKLHGPSLTVGECRAAFADDHVHMLLIVQDDRVAGTLVRGDVPGVALSSSLALRYATASGRTVAPTTPVDVVRAEMVLAGVRRLVVVDEHSALLGLLCLKCHSGGFCGDGDVAHRAAERPPSLTEHDPRPGPCEHADADFAHAVGPRLEQHVGTITASS